jgi:hypothetical protein
MNIDRADMRNVMHRPGMIVPPTPDHVRTRVVPPTHVRTRVVHDDAVGAKHLHDRRGLDLFDHVLDRCGFDL